MSGSEPRQKSGPSWQELQAELERVRAQNGDVLAVWRRIISWVESHPTDDRSGGLRSVVERCIEDCRYRRQYEQDERLLVVFQKLMTLSKHAGPLLIYLGLFEHKLFTSLSTFYVAWARELETYGDRVACSRVFLLGEASNAQPAELLQRAHTEFLTRYGMQEDEHTQNFVSALCSQSSASSFSQATVSQATHRHQSSHPCSVAIVSLSVTLVNEKEISFEERRAERTSVPSSETVPPFEVFQDASANSDKNLPLSNGSRKPQMAGTTTALKTTVTFKVYEDSSVREDHKTLADDDVAASVTDHVHVSFEPPLHDSPSVVAEVAETLTRLQELDRSRLTIGEATFAKMLVVPRKPPLISTPNYRSGFVIAPKAATASANNHILPPSIVTKKQTPTGACGGDVPPDSELPQVTDASILDEDDEDKKIKEELLRSRNFAEISRLSEDEDVQDLNRTGYGLQEDIVGPLNPWDPALVAKFLQKTSGLQKGSRSYCESNCSLPRVMVGRNLPLNGKNYLLKQLVGKGAFASVYLATVVEDNQLKRVAVKVQKPGCPWEQYISDTILRRLTRRHLGNVLQDGFAWIREAHVFSNGSAMVLDYFEHQSLLHVVNRYRNAGQSMKEPLVAYFTLEILKLLYALRTIEIIHADIKPDNFALVHPPPVFDDRGCVDAANNNFIDFARLPITCIKLFDFGRSIDMSLLPRGSTFTGVVYTSNFVCCEMQDGRPWTYQTDYFGLLGTICVLIDGKYMKTFKSKTTGVWTSTVQIQRSWDKQTWMHLFDSLLNVPSCEELPDLCAFINDFTLLLNKAVTPSLSAWEMEVRKLKKILA